MHPSGTQKRHASAPAAFQKTYPHFCTDPFSCVYPPLYPTYQVFVDLLHIHWGIWLAVCMLVQLDLFVQTSFIRPAQVVSSGGRRELAAAVSSSSSSSASASASGSAGSGSSSIVYQSPLSLIDYCVVAGLVLTFFLAIIYWKVLQV